MSTLESEVNLLKQKVAALEATVANLPWHVRVFLPKSEPTFAERLEERNRHAPQRKQERLAEGKRRLKRAERWKRSWFWRMTWKYFRI